MIARESNITVAVDVTNPGQFFACCGLLELADRLWPGAEGWFERTRFSVNVGNLEDVLEYLVRNTPQEVKKLESGLLIKPLLAPLRFSFESGSPNLFTIDAWVTIAIQRAKAVAVANRPWNFWSGQQTSFQIWSDLRTALIRQLPGLQTSVESLFSHTMPVTGRFGFDPGAAWNALDVGFSPNTQQMPVASSPATEMLAAIGIQRFRPLLSDDKKSFVYSTWGKPLAPSVAAAAAASLVCIAPWSRFRGRVEDRGSYAALGYSTTVDGGFNG